MGQLQMVVIGQIRENPVALRAVNRKSEEYLGLCDSIKAKGVLNAISLRPKTDPETKLEFYEIVDGLHRFSAAKDVGLAEIPAQIITLDDGQTLEAQIMANVHKVETRPVEYSRQLLRLLSMNPLMTEAELAHKIGKSSQWIAQRFYLTKVESKEIAGLIDEGKIGLANAYALAKLPPIEQPDWVARAMTLGPDEFVPAVNGRVKEIKEAARKGKDAEPDTFQPVPYLQKIGAIKDEMDKSQIAPALIARTNATTANDGFALAIAWVLHLDPQSVDEQKAKYDQRKAEQAEAKKKRDEERAKKAAEKEKEAASVAATLAKL